MNSDLEVYDKDILDKHDVFSQPSLFSYYGMRFLTDLHLPRISRENVAIQSRERLHIFRQIVSRIMIDVSRLHCVKGLHVVDNENR